MNGCLMAFLMPRVQEWYAHEEIALMVAASYLGRHMCVSLVENQTMLSVITYRIMGYHVDIQKL